MPPRGVFAQKFAELFVAAGNPSMRRVAMQAEARMHGAVGRVGTTAASSQRISDWVAGRNVPARFDSLVPVLLTLIDAAKKQGRPPGDPLLDLQWWRRLWKQTEAAKTANTVAECPYPGLAAYRRDDSALFFGRTEATKELAALVAKALDDAAGIVVLVGASGAGKSSLLAAGLIPTLLRAKPAWKIAVLSPGGAPIGTLRETIDTQPTSGRRLLIVDQFEELFTGNQDEAESAEFFELIGRLAAQPGHAVVLGLRADFYARCLDYPALADALEHRSHVLGPMRLDELAQTVNGPADVAGLKLEPGLRDLVVAELCGLGDHRQNYDPGALPLLSHVMAAVWSRREGKRLTIACYREAGGVAGSIAATAEQAWSGLTEPQRTAARHLLLGLVAVGHDSRDTRRRVRRSELLTRAADADAACAALETLTRSRLITLDSADTASDATVYLTHEIVVDAWPRLRAWIDEDRVSYLVRQRLEADAAEWTAAKRDPSLLYRGTRLAAAAELTPQPPDASPAAAFLAASRADRDRSHRLAVTTRAILGVLGAVVLVLAVAAYGQSRKALAQRNDAVFAGILAEADSVADTDPSLSADLDLVADQLRPGNPEVRTRLLSTQNRPLATNLPTIDGAVYALAYSAHGLLASAHDDGRVRLWNVAGRPHAVGGSISANIGFTATVAFNPDGTLLATGGEDHLVRLWNVRNPATPREVGAPLAAGTGAVYIVAFSPNGHLLAAADDDHTVTLWNITDPTRPHSIGTIGSQAGPVRALAFSPDGRTLAAGSDDGTTQLWDLTAGTPRPLGPPTSEFAGSVHALAFAPDGARLAVAGDDGLVRLWDVRDPAAPTPLGAPWSARSGAIWSVAFAGTTLVTSGSEGVAKLWDVDNPADPALVDRPLAGSKGSVFAIAASPDGRGIATGGQDGVVRLWSLPDGGLAGRIDGAVRPAFDPRGRLMVAAGLDGDVLVWNMRDPRDPRRVGALADAGRPQRLAVSPDARTVAVLDRNPTQLRLYDVTDPATPRQLAAVPLATRFTDNVAFSPTAALLVTGSDDRSIQVWDIADRRSPTRLGGPVQVSANWVRDLAYSPDGRTLAIADKDSRITLWDMAHPMRPIPRGDGFRAGRASLNDVALRPDGRTLVTADDSETVRAWDISDPAHVVPLGDSLAGHDSPVAAVDFNSDGTVLASGGEDATVRLWDFTDPTHPQPLGSSLTPGSAATWKVAFDPAGGYLAAAASDNTLHLWNLDPAPATARICATTGGVLTPAVWTRLIPSLRYRSPCR